MLRFLPVEKSQAEYSGALRDLRVHIIALHHAGFTAPQIAEKLGLSFGASAIKYALGRWGEKPANTAIFPEYHRALEEHAWMLRAEGLTYRAIGKRLGITGGRTAQIVLKFGQRCQRALRRASWVKIGEASQIVEQF